MITTITGLIIGLHAYYISFTEMEYNKESKAIEVSIKLTAHDLVKELEGIYSVRVNFEKNDGMTRKIILKYLNDHFTLSQGKDKLEITMDGYEYDLSGDLFLFLRFEGFKVKKSFRFENKILLQYFPEQQNICSIKIGGKTYQKTLTVKDFELLSNE